MSFRLPSLALLLLVTAGVQAQDAPEWVATEGPYGGFASDLVATDVAGAYVALATHYGTLYRSTDGGERWARVEGFEPGYGTLFGASDGTFWVVGGSVYASADGGLTWSAAGEGLPSGEAGAISEGPDGTLYAATSAGVYRRAPADDSWSGTGFTEAARSVGVGPTGTILTGATEPGFAEDLAVWRSVDDGDTWTRITLASGVQVPGAAYAIEFAPDGTALVGAGPAYKLYDGPVLLRSTDDGLSWSEGGGIEASDVSDVYIASDHAAYARWSGEAYRSEDGGVTWERAAHRVYGAVQRPDGAVLVATFTRGILRSDDGNTWLDSTHGFGRALIGELAVDPTGRTFAAAPKQSSLGSPAGLHRTSDGGATWQRVELPFANYGFNDMVVGLDGALFLAPATGGSFYGSLGLGLFRSRDGGDTWEDVSIVDSDGVPFRTSHIERSPDGSLWAIVSALGISAQMHRSTDGGDTWERRADPPFARAFTAGPDGSLWLGASQFQDGIQAARSTDGAATWEVVLSEPGLRVGGIGVASTGTAIVSANPQGYRAELGGPWAPVDLALQQTYVEVDAFAETDSGVLYGAADGGDAVVRSLDDGVTWGPASDGLPEAGYAPDLAIDGSGFLWLANGTTGVFRTANPVSVEGGVSPGPTEVLSVAAHPNPFSRWTTVVVDAGEPQEHASVEVLDALGRRIAVLHAGPLAAGRHELRFEGAALGPGLYLVQVLADGGASTARLTLTE